ncbi:excinuclease ABC subunit C [Pedobacter ginsenosidimutans]|uniref:Excinuclease ABC subunit C n=1 Tax=Pedobacter ginsenosidimutans TaxID=687842 RepID=A0A0T5VNW2_9SPHI|nr:GIY-YIG nuclease family protein [Pedobacter ginsenosidimutans]KRT15554.1 excinuclease ABC subunit C [Pedobacter ginsenosidimutans]
MELGGWIYIMTNYEKTTLYIGVTSDLRSRVYDHQNKIYPDSFTAKYNLIYCVYFEDFQSIEEAINREKQLKKWNRSKKETLINNFNKNWNDLTEVINEWDE